MTVPFLRKYPRVRAAGQKLAVASMAALLTGSSAFPADSGFGGPIFFPGNLLVSRSVYDNNSKNVKIGEVLPPNCGQTQGGCSAPTGAPYNGSYPEVWNNDSYDASFGITSASLVNSIELPNSSTGGPQDKDNIVTSFSSKSELALHLSTDNKWITFMGYIAPIDAVDVSNSNTSGAVDLTNPVGQNFYRAVAQIDGFGRIRVTETNAYSGNNGRSVILNAAGDVFYTAGNAGNGGSPQPDDVVLGAGTQFIAALDEPEKEQHPATPAPLASFSVTQLGAKADKIGKDDNFRGIAIHDNVLYYTKGSGSNGVNTVYFVDTTGKACPNGVGLPSKSARLPTSPLPYDAATLQKNGLPSNMCILAGFPSTPNKTVTVTAYPFAIWFADDQTLYVTDEGDGYTGALIFTGTLLRKRQPACRSGFLMTRARPGSLPTL
jgi:hypothetical protein